MSEETPESKYQRLPDDLVRDILLRLPAKSIARFRCSSKSWLSISTHPSFLLAHIRRSRNSLLIHTTKHHSDDSDLRQIKLHLLPTAAATVLPERRRSTTDVVFASCDGLLCLRDKLRESIEDEEDIPCYYVLNPLTGAQIDIPKPNCSLGHLMGLYFHPSTCEYRLIRRINSNSVFDKVELLTLGGEAWRTIAASPPRGSVCARTPIDLNGSLYWIAYNTTEFRASGVLGFDIMEEEFKLIPLPPGDRHLYANSSLIDMGERLGLSIINRELSADSELGIDVWVVNSSLIDMGERLGLSIINRELSAVSELGIDVWVVKDYETVEWEKMYSVRCSGGLNRIDFRFGYWVDDIALCIRKEKMVVLFVGPRSYLVQFDLKARKYCTEQVLDPEDLMWHFSLLYKESLVSYDSFCNR